MTTTLNESPFEDDEPGPYSDYPEFPEEWDDEELFSKELFDDEEWR